MGKKKTKTKKTQKKLQIIGAICNNMEYIN